MKQIRIYPARATRANRLLSEGCLAALGKVAATARGRPARRPPRGRRGGVRVRISAGKDGGALVAARILAGMLDADVYRIDLGAVAGKYLGETAAQLNRVLDAAEQSSAVLLLDEADALLGTHAHVKDGADRYADLEIDYLLQRLEAYRGVVIVTIGRGRRRDRAFFRRCDFVIRVPSPGKRRRFLRAKNS